MRASFFFVACAAAGLVLSSAAPASAVTIFQDDFEAYAVGSDLSTEGGWTGVMSLIQLSSAGGLGAANKVSAGASANFETTSRGIGLFSTANVYTVKFDGYGAGSHNSAAGMRNSAAPVPNSPLGSIGFNADIGGHWQIYASDAAGTSLFSADTGISTASPYHMTIVLNGPAGTAQFFMNNFSNGTLLYTSPLETYAAAQIGALDSVFVTHRGSGTGFTPGEFDAFLVTSTVPEPGTAALAVLGLAALRRARRRGRATPG